MSAGFKFVKVRSVTRPVLKIEGSPVYFTVQGAIYKAPVMEDGSKAKKGEDGNPLPPPDLMNVINLETGEESLIVVNTVLGKNLQEHYPSDAYVNKSFEVVKFQPNKAAGKRYATFSISEIEVTPVEEAPKPEATKGKK